MLEQTPGDYQNTPANVAVSPLAKPNDSQAATGFTSTRAAAQSEEDESSLDDAAAEQSV